MADVPKVVPLPLSRARQQLVEEALPHVRKLARAYARAYGYDYDELVSHGSLGLTDAARRFDQAEEVPFIVFAYSRVRGEMLDAAAKARRQASRMLPIEPNQLMRDLSDDPDPEANEVEARVALSRAADIAVMAYVLCDEQAAFAKDPTGTTGEPTHPLRQAVASLESPLRELVEMHYFGGVSLKEVASKLGLAYRTAKRRHADALATLSKRLRRSA